MHPKIFWTCQEKFCLICKIFSWSIPEPYSRQMYVYARKLFGFHFKKFILFKFVIKRTMVIKINIFFLFYIRNYINFLKIIIKRHSFIQNVLTPAWRLRRRTALTKWPLHMEWSVTEIEPLSIQYYAMNCNYEIDFLKLLDFCYHWKCNQFNFYL